MNESSLVERNREFIECEAHSLHGLWLDDTINMYMMCGGSVAIEDIVTGLAELRKQGYMQ